MGAGPKYKKFHESMPHFHGKKQHTTKNFYDFYINNLVDKDNPKNPYVVDWKTYKAIVDDFFKAVMDYMLYENYVFDPGVGIGIFFIAKMYRGKMNNLAVNWKETRKQGKIVHHLNDHTNYFLYKILWKTKRRDEAAKTNIATYRFLPSRANKRLLARLILDEGYDYFEYKKGDEFKMM